MTCSFRQENEDVGMRLDKAPALPSGREEVIFKLNKTGGGRLLSSSPNHLYAGWRYVAEDLLRRDVSLRFACCFSRLLTAKIVDRT